MITRRLSRPRVLFLQCALIAILLLAWQFVPAIPGVSQRWAFLDPFFISSPTRVASQLVDLATGRSGNATLWLFVWATVSSALVGTLIGVVTGAAAGLLLSNDERINQVLRPLLVAFNAVPRIALIPIVVIILGPSMSASVVTAVLVVFFVVFFNAFEGGRTVPAQVLENARVMGARPWQIMREIRFKYVVAWTFAALPNAVSFGLVSVVTAEILTGYAGMGRLLVVALNSASASLTFAVVIFLSVVGIVLVAVSEIAKRRYLHWWNTSSENG